MVHKDIKKEVVGIPSTRIKRVGIFDLDTLYHEITDWLVNKKYSFTEKDTSAKKDKPVREFKFVFSGKRDLNDYFRYNLEIEIWAYKVTVVKIKGKRYYDAHVEVTVKANYHKNYKKTFKWEWMRRIYEQYFILKRVFKYEGKLFKEVNSLKDIIKEILKLIKA